MTAANWALVCACVFVRSWCSRICHCSIRCNTSAWHRASCVSAGPKLRSRASARRASAVLGSSEGGAGGPAAGREGSAS
eukprot:498788-Lingulodinium_polyedra.AAC.1